jgi:AraC family transcriptional regulator, regulatory protein of adaptative response / methylated-DNA-[protein]-cysteine methyltransferase
MRTRAICARSRIRRPLVHRSHFDAHLLPAGLPGASAAQPQRSLFSERIGCGSCGLPAVLRCRPETAPQSPAWTGARATVSRALRLIDEGALDHAGVDQLAERLGIGARHLARLFRRYLHTTPTAAARTTRVQRAKRLIDTSDLSMIEIADLAGFQSLRAFNASFRQVYRVPPSRFRRATTPRHDRPNR